MELGILDWYVLMSCVVDDILVIVFWRAILPCTHIRHVTQKHKHLIGEILVVIMFTYNSLQHHNSPYLAMGVAFVAFLLTLWLRGNPWKYATVVALEALLALLAALAFPIMEMILEQILHDKLRRVGDKVRAHAERLEAYYHANSKN